ncbi:NAD-dependent epimerase/dehydratase family protein [Roseovarius sp. 2305UL8-3]|uniref:NAD-dependent epimerase/dehydratase family protein n=1 Tax=Roseovarius conchicola TaxID=3121636 RepID=UPI003526D9E6
MEQPAFSIDTHTPVLVTGASGYVAGWIVHDLLAAGVTVHGTVRDPDNAAKTAHLTEMNARLPGSLKLFKADLLDAGSFAEAMEGCGIVFHTASPFTVSVDDPQTGLVDPALNGTRHVLDQVNKTPSVDRVVLTSSVVAMYGDMADIAEDHGGTLTEEAWNTTSSLDHQPYAFSKLLAEREAWRIAEAQDHWKMVVINPSLVIGPAIGPAPTSESFAIVKAYGDGRTKTGAPRLNFGVVDVRDLARAHLAAAYLPEATGRHIICGKMTDMAEMGMLLKDRFGADYPIPPRAMPKWLFWLVGPMLAPITRRYVTRNVGHPIAIDNSKSINALGQSYRPLKTSIEDMFEQMAERGSFG